MLHFICTSEFECLLGHLHSSNCPSTKRPQAGMTTSQCCLDDVFRRHPREALYSSARATVLPTRPSGSVEREDVSLWHLLFDGRRRTPASDGDPDVLEAWLRWQTTSLGALLPIQTSPWDFSWVPKTWKWGWKQNVGSLWHRGNAMRASASFC